MNVNVNSISNNDDEYQKVKDYILEMNEIEGLTKKELKQLADQGLLLNSLKLIENEDKELQ